MLKKTPSRLFKKKVRSFLYYKEKSTKVLGNLILRDYCVSFFSSKEKKRVLKKMDDDFLHAFDVVNNYLDV